MKEIPSRLPASRRLPTCTTQRLHRTRPVPLVVVPSPCWSAFEWRTCGKASIKLYIATLTKYALPETTITWAPVTRCRTVNLMSLPLMKCSLPSRSGTSTISDGRAHSMKPKIMATFKLCWAASVAQSLKKCTNAYSIMDAVNGRFERAATVFRSSSSRHARINPAFVSATAGDSVISATQTSLIRRLKVTPDR